MRNRERRAARAKQRDRQRAQGRSSRTWPGEDSAGAGVFGAGVFGSPPSAPSVADLAKAVLAAAESCARGDAAAPAECAAKLSSWPFTELHTVVERAVDMAALDGLTHAWRNGWQPADLWQLIRRRLSGPAVGYLVELLAADADRYSPAAFAPAWQAQLRQLGARVNWPADQPHLGQWAARAGMSRAEAVELVVSFLALLRTVPRLDELVAPPGSPARSGPASAGARATGSPRAAGPASGGASHPAGGVDEKVLAKVRALLAKAESTEFEQEADAFFAKAQELMSRYSLERAVLDADHGRPASGGPGGRRIWLDAPYLSAKSLLVNAVAGANRARAVFHQHLGFVTVLGDEVDLEIVELLSTSLLLQASRAMVHAGRQIDRRGQSRTKSFRQSFLVSYAARIGERLSEASAAAQAEVVHELGDGRLLPVLASRERAVDELFERLFPALTTRRVSVSNPAGWGAGRAAADLADLDVRRSVRG